MLKTPICEISEKDIKYWNKLILSNLTHLMSMVDLLVIYVETLRMDNRCSLEKELIELICMNPRIVLYLSISQVDSCHGCVHGHLT